MPNTYVPSGQDWDGVNVGRASAGRAEVPKTAAGITAAKASGLLTTEKRFGAGGNSSAHSATVMSARKLDEADDFKLAKVDRSLSKAIMQARTAKKMTQKDLSTAINEKPQVVAEYESGKAIPNPAIIAKIERVLGCKLPRPTAKKTNPVKTTTVPKSAAGSSGAKTNGITRGGPPKRR